MSPNSSNSNLKALALLLCFLFQYSSSKLPFNPLRDLGQFR
jgi:hypothetical protein